MPLTDTNALIDERVEALRRFHRQLGIDRAQLDLSGGVDSAVMLGLLARALGPRNITAVHSMIDTDPAATGRAREVAASCHVPLVEIELSAVFAQLTEGLQRALIAAGAHPTELTERLERDPTILGSIRSTLRAPVGRGANRMSGDGIRHGTGNECEDRWLRFFQKGGDGEVDTNPIAMLSKGEVYQLARALDLPQSVIAARPSPDLWGVGDVHSDEDELATYLKLDPRGETFYSSIDLRSGRYLRVGLVERLSRFLDEPLDGTADGRVEATLFRDDAGKRHLQQVLVAARSSPSFAGLPESLVEALVLAARGVERRTRHKVNPACPTLGDRAELLRRGLVTDTLPTPVPART